MRIFTRIAILLLLDALLWTGIVMGGLYVLRRSW